MPTGVYKRKKGVFNHSKESKDKIKLARSKQKISKESYEKAKKTRARSSQERGYYHSQKTRDKIGEANKIALKGNKLSKENIKKRTITRRKNGWYRNRKGYLLKVSGKNSWLWKGGKSFEPYGLEFNKTLKKEIKKRDDYQCKMCGKFITRYGYVHHIDYDKTNNKSTNLIFLCNSCHSKTNFNRRMYKEILSVFMSYKDSKFKEVWSFVETPVKLKC